MTLNLTSVVMLSVGIVLMYGAVNDLDPRDVVRQALNKPAKYSGAPGNNGPWKEDYWKEPGGRPPGGTPQGEPQQTAPVVSV